MERAHPECRAHKVVRLEETIGLLFEMFIHLHFNREHGKITHTPDF